MDDLNRGRPKPQLEMNFTPDGVVWEEVRSQEAMRINREITAKINAMQERLNVRKGQARDGFKKAHGRGRGR
ncbi:hypothetical protein MLD52_09550 [Puniceicoccaceae bacterium K14]|nr:hypothetical protein [Puniceicoccaceae bacterium K14]